MISVDGKAIEEIVFDGPRSHLDVKAFTAAGSSICGRGSIVATINGQRIRIVVRNDGVGGESHSAIEER